MRIHPLPPKWPPHLLGSNLLKGWPRGKRCRSPQMADQKMGGPLTAQSPAPRPEVNMAHGGCRLPECASDCTRGYEYRTRTIHALPLRCQATPETRVGETPHGQADPKKGFALLARAEKMSKENVAPISQQPRRIRKM